MLHITTLRSGLARTLAVACALGAGVAVATDRPGVAAQQARPPGWNDSTHSQMVAPDYRRLFAMDRVHELRITIPADSFRAMQEDLRTVTPGLPARGGGVGPAAGIGAAPAMFFETAIKACSERTAGEACTIQGQDGRCNALLAGQLVCAPRPPADVARGAMGRGGAPQLAVRDPMYVAVTVEHEGRVWMRVGMRYKGNSSLMSANVSGNGKVPFRLDFDRYEDDSPETRDQRFYGFQKLTFSSNFGDDSQLREVFATEVLRDRGVPAARAAFYRILVDTGTGPEYWGLYTMIEDPADGAMLDAQFGGRQGNLYKPEGPGSNWTEFHPEGFGKKTNESAGDFSDISSAIAALHASQADRAAWRAGLEAVFDVDHFLRWLAVNTALLNWDAYGALAHNYYLYGDPAHKGRLRWIPWDHNFSLGGAPIFAGPRRGGPPPQAPFPPAGAGPAGGGIAGIAVAVGRGGFPGGIFGGMTDVLHSQAGEGWPLIRLLLADPLYAARYRVHLEHALGGAYSLEAAEARLRQLHALIAPALVGERGERPTHTTISSPEGFESSLEGPAGVLTIVRQRHEAIRAALKGVKAP